MCLQEVARACVWLTTDFLYIFLASSIKMALFTYEMNVSGRGGRGRRKAGLG